MAKLKFNIIRFLASYMNDKALHFTLSFLFALYSTECAIVAAFVKEYTDDIYSENVWDWKDMGWNILGIISGTIVRLMIFQRWNII